MDRCQVCNKKKGIYYFLIQNKEWYQCSQCHKSVCYDCIHICERNNCGNRICRDCVKTMEGDILLANEILDQSNIPKGNAFSSTELCNNCFNELNPLIDKYKQALEMENQIETFQTTYKGKIHIKNNSELEKISTDYRGDKETLMKVLRVSAVFLKCNIVYNIKWIHKTESSGNYMYSLFSAEGIPATKRNIFK